MEEKGPFTNEEFLNEARKKSCPVHKYYVWDKDAAHEIYLRRRTQEIITSVEIHITEHKTLRMMYRVHFADSDEYKYAHLDYVRAHEDLWVQVLKEALREAREWQERYQELKQLAPIFREIERTERRTQKWLTKNESPRKKRKLKQAQ